MTQEEKAKAYDEAKARMIEAYNSNRCTIDFMDEIFPESTESEDDDEVVRKELIDAIHGLWDNDALPMPLTIKRKDNWLAWLEKQGKQKPTFRERYENITQSEWFKRTHEGVSVNNDGESRWTEEDESKVEDIVYFLNTAKTHYASTKALDDCITWLKSLKQKVGWKPSKKQLTALQDANSGCSYDTSALATLLDDLKKITI